MAQQPQQFTPDQALASARFLAIMGKVEMWLMPWVMLGVFVLSGMAKWQPKEPYIVFEGIFILVGGIGAMVMMYISGVAIQFVAEIARKKAEAELSGKQPESSGPILEKRGA